VPTQNNLLLKYSKFKMIGIIIYNYIATTFFFLLMFQFLFSDFFGSGSEREGLWVWDLGSLGFLQGLIGFILDFGGFQDRFSGVGLATVCF